MFNVSFSVDESQQNHEKRILEAPKNQTTSSIQPTSMRTDTLRDPKEISEDEFHDNDVIYALRTVHQHQSNLLMLADQKANILIGIMVLVLTVLFTNLSFISTAISKFTISFASFFVFEGASLFFALLVIMPKTVGRIQQTKIEDVPNPFFFGFYSRFQRDDFLKYIIGQLDNSRSARFFLARDLYDIGKVLSKKYTLLKFAYLLAVAGLLVLFFSAGLHVAMNGGIKPAP